MLRLFKYRSCEAALRDLANGTLWFARPDTLRVAGGDPMVPIKALILGQQSLQEAFAERISAGYVRRGLRG